MISSSKSITAQFIEFREAHQAAGGKPRGIKYTESLRRAAVSYLRSEAGNKISVIAAELGIGEGALKKWEARIPRSRQVGVRAPTFLPVDVVRGKVDAPLAKSASSSLVVTCREISVDLGAIPDESLLRAVLAMLQSRQGGASL